jgi:hypothetical protein
MKNNNLWIVYYNFDGTARYGIYNAKHSLQAKEMCIKENNFNNIDIIEVEVCNELPEDLIEIYKSRIASLI